MEDNEGEGGGCCDFGGIEMRFEMAKGELGKFDLLEYKEESSSEQLDIEDKFEAIELDEG